MNYKELASSIISLVGGKENIAHLEHCSTRLRFSLVDDKKAQADKIKALQGVLNVIEGKQQFQVVIGNEVVEVYNEVEKLVDGSFATTEAPKKSFEWKDAGSYLLDFIVGVFQPLVPAMAGGGILKSLMTLCAAFGWIDKAGSTYQIFTLIGDAPLYFLPLLVAITTARKLKANHLVAMSVVGALLLPNMLALLGKSADLFGVGLQNIAYPYQVFPAILTVIVYAFLEKQLTKVTPKAIRIFFVPMVSMLVTVPLALLILGPLGYNVGTLFATVVLFLFEKVGWVAVGLLAAVLPFMVSTGMHKAMIPYAVATMGELKKEALYMPASLAHNIAESGATFAVALKTKDQTLKATALSAGISAFCGITEPALYGVTLLHKKVLASVVLGSLVSGLYLGYAAVEAYVLVGPGFPAMSMFVSETIADNFLKACIGFAISFVVSFVLAFVLYKDEVKEESDKATVVTSEDLNAFATGKVVALDQVPDEVFSSKVLGEGVAIESVDGKLLAPANGTVEMVYQTKHALGFKTDLGNEILFHIGLETVKLEGKFFDVKVKEGDAVDRGTVLVEFDQEAIKEAGYNPIVIAIFTNRTSEKVDFEVVEEANPEAKLATLV